MSNKDISNNKLFFDQNKNTYIYSDEKVELLPCKSKVISVNNNRHTLSSPLRIYYDITYNCNLSCKYCYNKNKVNSSRNYLTLNEKMSLIDTMRKNTIYKLSIAGGEPFIDKDIFQIIEYAYKNGINVSVTSNGTLIRERELEFLRKNLLTSFTISIDDITELGNKQRVGQDFDLVSNNIIKVSQETNVNLALKMVIDIDFDIKKLERVVKFSEKFNVKTVKLSFLRKDKNNLISQKDFTKKYYDLAMKIDKVRKDTNVKIKGINTVLTNKFGRLNKTLGWGCAAGKDLLYISPYGDIKPCVMLDDDFFIGNIRDEDILELWSKANNVFEKDSECDCCKYEYICYGGCRARAIQYKKNIKARDVLCFKEIENEYIEYKHKIEGNLNDIDKRDEVCLTHL
ncbi:radical SAM protein [Clostridium sp.]|uniref:radical SAM protein n=1 Tax=Clostridium sp. TaxID=1506 RepID=UPI003F3DFD5C